MSIYESDSDSDSHDSFEELTSSNDAELIVTIAPSRTNKLYSIYTTSKSVFKKNFNAVQLPIKCNANIRLFCKNNKRNDYGYTITTGTPEYYGFRRIHNVVPTVLSVDYEVDPKFLCVPQHLHKNVLQGDTSHMKANTEENPAATPLGLNIDRLRIYLKQEQILTKNLNAINVKLCKQLQEKCQMHKAATIKLRKKVAFVERKLRMVGAEKAKLHLLYSKLLKRSFKKQNASANLKLSIKDSQASLDYMLDLYALWNIPFAELHKNYVQSQTNLHLRQLFENSLLKIERANILIREKQHKSNYFELINKYEKRELRISESLLLEGMQYFKACIGNDDGLSTLHKVAKTVDTATRFSHFVCFLWGGYISLDDSLRRCGTQLRRALVRLSSHPSPPIYSIELYTTT